MTTQAPNERDSIGLLREIREVSTVSDSSVNRNARLESTEESHPPVQSCLNKYALLCAIGASVTSILLGFDIGVMSEGWVYTKKDNRLTDRQLEYLAAILNVVSLFGSAMAGRTSDWIGRRYTMTLTGVFFFFGTLLMGISTNNALLLLGRILTHVGVGFAPLIASIYIAEISPPSFRGLLTSIPEVSINFGTLLGYIFHYPASKVDLNLGLRVMLSLGVISLFLLAIGVLVMPESPRWLVMQGRLADARSVLAKTSDSEQEAARRLDDIKVAVGIPVGLNEDVVQVNMPSNGEGVCRELLHSTQPVFHMLWCAVVINLLQQGCGIDTIILHSPRFFEKAGVTSSNNKLSLTITIQIVKTLLILIPTFHLDRVGRRQLLLRSIGGMIFALTLLGVCLTFIDHSDAKPKWAMAMIIPLLLLCVAFYSMGMGPVTSVYSSEIFPLRLRSQGYAIGLALNQALGAILSVAFLPLYEAITLGGAAFFFMAIAIFAWLFVYTIMPETRGRTLEEMWQFFGEFIVWRSPARETEMHRISPATSQGAENEASL